MGESCAVESERVCGECKASGMENDIIGIGRREFEKTRVEMIYRELGERCNVNTVGAALLSLYGHEDRKRHGKSETIQTERKEGMRQTGETER